tara:strand:+ start:998 stop:2224 length:1227 start_codon:yes stop_codon:yes gene_type:complete
LLIFISPFFPKIRKHLYNQKSTWILANYKIKNNAKGKTVILFHAASSGEYEQLVPILKIINRNKYFIILSFFSPTIYELEKDNPLAEHVVYLPFDFPWSIKNFYKLVSPSYHITTRHDIWPNLLTISNNMGIKNILINANLYNDSIRKYWFFIRFNKYIFSKFDKIMTGSNRIKENFKDFFDIKNITITGDSRFDQVLNRKLNNQKTQLPSSFNNSNIIIFGSILPSDYNIIFKAINSYYNEGNKTLIKKNHKLIFVPHENNRIEITYLLKMLKKYNFNPSLYTDNLQNIASNTLIVNVIGKLADLYNYSKISYIGGGFSNGVHSVIEPAIYGNAISYGPNYSILDEAVSLYKNNISYLVKNDLDLKHFFKLLDDKKKLNIIKDKTINFVKDRTGASEKIVYEIFNNL